MSGERYYKLFGLSHDASEGEIKAAYKKLAKINHPDKSKSSKSVEKFQEIQEAYTYLLQQVKRKDNRLESEHGDENFTREKVDENDWTAYRNRARKVYQEKKKKQEQELENWYIRLKTGWNRKLFLGVVILSCMINSIFILDCFLPKKMEEDRVESYSKEKYNSLDNHPVSVIETKNNRTLWLNKFNNAHFDDNPFIKIEVTPILHHPLEVSVSRGFRIHHIPVHLNLYWGQLVVQAILLLPLLCLFYKKNDAFFIMGHYLTIFLVGGLILYFLITENRLIHIITLGNV